MTTTIKVTGPTRDRINSIGRETGRTAEEVVSAALDEYERHLFWQAQAAAVAAHPLDPADTELWDNTLNDGAGEW